MKVLFAVFFCLFWSGWAAAQTLPCTASFTYTNPSPGVYSFTNSSTPSMPGSATWSWDFGDGTTASVMNPTHTFSASGTYCVTLTIATGNGCVATDTQCITVTGGSAPVFNCANVNAAFTYSAGPNNVYTFTSTSTNTNTGPVTTTYAWYFGDGTPFISGNAAQSSHVYAFAGSYNVMLITTWANAGATLCQDTAFQTITVGNMPTFSCANVTAGYTYTDTNWTCSFTNTTTNTNTAPATVTYEWHFGDGGTDTLASPVHFYSNPGTYNVWMVATWSANGSVLCQDSSGQQVVISGGIPPTNEISAVAIWDSGVNADSASVKFWLIAYDSVAQTLMAVDSFLMPCFSNINYASAYWNNLPAGDYRVKAHMIDQPSSWTTGFLPTYADSAYNWQSATVMNHTGTTTGTAIYLRQGIPMTGPGFISGSVLQGANRGTAVGDPMGNITILLRNNANNQLVASTETDANGTYTFGNVPLGTYNVYPEELNYATTPSAPIQITANNTNSTTNDFWRETVAKTLHPITPTGVKAVQQEGQILISPNPAKDLLSIQFATAPQKGSTVQLYNLSGQLVKAFPITDAQTTQQLSLSGIAAGNYLLHIPTATGTQVARITIQP